MASDEEVNRRMTKWKGFGRKLHNEEQIKARRMRWAGHVARMGEERNVYRVLVGKSTVKKPLGR
jgi:hypothetical protein